MILDLRKVITSNKEIEGVIDSYGQFIVKKPLPSDRVTFHTHPPSVGYCRPSLVDLVRVCWEGYKHHYIFCGSDWVWEFHVPPHVFIAPITLRKIKQKRDCVSLLRKKGVLIRRARLPPI